MCCQIFFESKEAIPRKNSVTKYIYKRNLMYLLVHFDYIMKDEFYPRKSVSQFPIHIIYYFVVCFSLF